jgi:hypothetical protein
MFKRLLLILLLSLSEFQPCCAASACPTPCSSPCPSPSDTAMTTITSWQDLKPFAGRVVAYITNSLLD